MRGCIILANGRPPGSKHLEFFRAHGYPFLICADGGAETAREMGLVPDLIAGDLDSVTGATLAIFTGVCTIEKIAAQYDTDVEKCLKIAIERGFTGCVLMGATGDRLDHSFNNIGIAVKYDPAIKIMVVSEATCMQVISGDLTINGVAGETVSLFGIDRETLFTTSGLQYPLNGESLPFGVRDGTSNVATTGLFSVSVEGGRGILMRELEKVIVGGGFDTN